MKNNYILIIGTFVVFSFAAFAFWLIKNPPQETAVVSVQTPVASFSPIPEEMLDLGTYVEYYDGVIEENSDKQRVLFFYANWCPTCRPLDAEIAKNINKIPKNTIVVRVNYNDDKTDSAEKELAKKYAVTYQHTLVVIDSVGREFKKWNGGDFQKILDNL